MDNLGLQAAIALNTAILKRIAAAPAPGLRILLWVMEDVQTPVGALVQFGAIAATVDKADPAWGHIAPTDEGRRMLRELDGDGDAAAFVRTLPPATWEQIDLSAGRILDACASPALAKLAPQNETRH